MSRVGKGPAQREDGLRECRTFSNFARHFELSSHGLNDLEREGKSCVSRFRQSSSKGPLARFAALTDPSSLRSVVDILHSVETLKDLAKLFRRDSNSSVRDLEGALSERRAHPHGDGATGTVLDSVTCLSTSVDDIWIKEGGMDQGG